MKIYDGKLAGIKIITLDRYRDARGYFSETYHEPRYLELGLPKFVQDNQSFSQRQVIRGLHYQIKHPQGKLVWVSRGEVFDVAVDIRRDSPTFGQWQSFHLTEEEPTQVYIPPGFAHGFCAISDEACFHYKCTDIYCMPGERGLRWDDPTIGITWPDVDPIVSDKDRALPYLKTIDARELPP